MPPDTKKFITGLYSLLPEPGLGEYLSSEQFTAFCREHGLTDTWKEHLETSKDRPDLYGRDSIRNAFILFFDHLVQTRPREFSGILAGFLRDFGKWSACPVPVDAIQRECVRQGFPDVTVEDEFLKIGSREERT
jgi:hypothetical protein